MNWKILSNNSKPENVSQEWMLEEHIPPWRRPSEMRKEDKREDAPPLRTKDKERGEVYVMPPSDESTNRSYAFINAALMLRRPILVKGAAGIGKSSLANYLAYILGLGAPLTWPINSKSTLQDGLYHYDAVGHLSAARTKKEHSVQISDYIRLNALGTALLPWSKPRVLLIDEIDKSSYDLPNDLLYILEEGQFTIPELVRTKSDDSFTIQTSDILESGKQGEHLIPSGGVVEMYHPPVIVMTSNNERDFSDAFLRRCIVLDFDLHTPDALWTIVKRHLQGESFSQADQEARSIEDFRSFFDELVEDNLPTDKVLQAMFLIAHGEQTRDIDSIKDILDR